MATINQKFDRPFESDTALEAINVDQTKQRKLETVAKEAVYLGLVIMGTGSIATGLYFLAHYLRHYQ